MNNIIFEKKLYFYLYCSRIFTKFYVTFKMVANFPNVSGSLSLYLHRGFLTARAGYFYTFLGPYCTDFL